MDNSDIRREARLTLSGNWVKAILVTLLVSLLGGLWVRCKLEFSIDILSDETQQSLAALLMPYKNKIIGSAIGLALLYFIIGGTIQLGYCVYLLKLYDGYTPSVGDIFSQFYRFSEGIVLHLLTSLYVFLWSLLFIIPGIVAAYRYAMAPYILAENPQMTAGEAITESKFLMDGNKMRLFLLDLSFFGWGLLSLVTVGVANLWINPYINLSYAIFYRQLNPYARAAHNDNTASTDM